jgi:uncharacterized protein
MLIEFRVENHRSIRSEQALSMEAGRGGDDDDPRPRNVAGHPESLLTVAAVYGANASGKSNLVNALGFMQHAVLESHRSWSPDDGVPRDPFAWGKKRAEPSLFEVTILEQGIRYEYGFTANDEVVLEEWLFAWPNGKKQTWYEREAGAFKFGDNLKGENKLIEEITRPNALFLSAAVQHKHSQLHPIYTWFRLLNTIGIHSRSFYSFAWQHEYQVARLIRDTTKDTLQQSLFEDDSSVDSLVDRFRSLLVTADIGILDLKVSDPEPREDARRRPNPRIQLKHRSEAADAWLPLEEESRGTRTLFRLGLPFLRAIDRGGALVVDELEASLHPVLARSIVDHFNDPLKNPNNAQLFFTTHDTNLLGTTVGRPALRRDQVWMTEKNPEGATVLYPLTDFKPRKSENLERGYLQGRYGAIPFLGDFTVHES